MAKNRKSGGAGEILSIRLPSALRDQLTRSAAKKKNRSLNHEIRERLTASLEEDADMLQRFGGHQNYAFWRLLSLVPHWVANPPKDAALLEHWLADPYEYEQVETAVKAIFAALRPPPGPKPEGAMSADALGWWYAGSILTDMKENSEELTAGEVRIRGDLDELVDRIPDSFFKDERIKSALLGENK